MHVKREAGVDFICMKTVCQGLRCPLRHIIFLALFTRIFALPSNLFTKNGADTIEGECSEKGDRLAVVL